MVSIKQEQFKKGISDKLDTYKYKKDWPVVYILDGDKEAYIGESLNLVRRTNEHLKKSDKKKLKNVTLISDDTFNKSVALDLESFLINHMASDGKYKLLNNNRGIKFHNYYEQDSYRKQFDAIWKRLQDLDLTINSIPDIENSDEYKYSPYKELNSEQLDALNIIMNNLKHYADTNEYSPTLIQGGAGTGKTVLAVYMVKYLKDLSTFISINDLVNNEEIKELSETFVRFKDIKVGLVIPMTSLRNTIKKVFKNISGLKKSMVLSPADVVKNFMNTGDKYDLLIIDESHRLKRRKALANYRLFDKKNEFLGLDKTGTELDWMFLCSQYQIFFYDQLQSIKPSDVTREYFNNKMNEKGVQTHYLNSQFRCMGGEDYIEYIKEILSDNPPSKRLSFEGYDLKLFDDCEKMISKIKKREQQYGISRVVAGYSWKWKTKGGKPGHDIEIQDKEYIWNSTSNDWINSPNSIDEIGCIHTVQGYDLNYVGVIFGNEITYNKKTKTIEIDKSQYWDIIGKTSLSKPEDLKEYILNIYFVLLTRGIRGTYIYVCDDDLREYLRTYF